VSFFFSDFSVIECLYGQGELIQGPAAFLFDNQRVELLYMFQGGQSRSIGIGMLILLGGLILVLLLLLLSRGGDRVVLDLLRGIRKVMRLEGCSGGLEEF